MSVPLARLVLHGALLAFLLTRRALDALAARRFRRDRERRHMPAELPVARLRTR